MLESIWLESDENDVEFLWRHRLRNAPWWAENALLAFEAVLADPPDDLCDFVEIHAGRGVSDESPMYGGQTCLARPASQRDRLKSIRGDRSGAALPTTRSDQPEGGLIQGTPRKRA